MNVNAPARAAASATSCAEVRAPYNRPMSAARAAKASNATRTQATVTRTNPSSLLRPFVDIALLLVPWRSSSLAGLAIKLVRIKERFRECRHSRHSRWRHALYKPWRNHHEKFGVGLVLGTTLEEI